MKPELRLQKIQNSLTRLRTWTERADWKAFDTFDGLSSPLAPICTLGIPLLKQIWQQGVRRFPANIRPWLLVKPSRSSKAMGFFAQGLVRLYQLSQDPRDLEQLQFCLQWLMDNRSPGFEGYAWGNHFDYQSRGGRIPLGTPTIVWTSLIGHAFLDAHDLDGRQEYLDVARGIGHFVLNELGWFETDHGDICLSYTPLRGGRPIKQNEGIHNSNVLGAGFLARLNHVAPNQRYLEHAQAAIKFTVRDQLPNGAWYYGAGRKWRWVDSFHTGYNLEAIASYDRYSGDTQFAESLLRGYTFFLKTFFGADGTPHYYDRKMRPLDIQCASQGIQTLVNLQHLHPDSVETAMRVAHWTIDNMQDPSGYFYYRKYPVITNKTPTLHWGQATMFAALATLLHHLNRQVEAAPLEVAVQR